MRLKSFTAASLALALEMVRKELGEEAIIVSTQPGAGGRGAREDFLVGWWFGAGLFGTGVSWVFVSLNQFGGLAAPFAAFATLAFCAFLALFPAVAGGLQAMVPAGPMVLSSLPPNRPNREKFPFRMTDMSVLKTLPKNLKCLVRISLYKSNTNGLPGIMP